MALDRDRVSRWITAYEGLWREGRSRDLGDLFTEDATYRASPSAAPLRGLAAIRRWWDAETDPAEGWRMTTEVLAVDGDVAIARLDVRYSAPAERRYLDLWILRFAPDGRCVAFEEWYWTPEFYAEVD